MQAAAALLILTAVSMIGFAALPLTIRSRATVAIPVSLPVGSLIAGWISFVAGLAVGTAAILPLFVVLTAIALMRARDWAHAIVHFARRIALLAKANPIAAAATVIVCALALPQLLLPLSDSDGVAYQVAMPKLFVLTGSIWYVPWTYASALPQTINMLYLIGLRIAGGETAKFLHFGYFLMSLLTLALIVHRGRRTRTAAFIAPFLYAAAPVVLAQSGAAFLDHAATMGVAAAALVIFRNASPLAAGLALGAAVATKITILPAAGGLILFAAATRRDRFRTAAAIVIPMIIAFAPFAIRNVMHTGDPIFPAGYGLLRRPMPGINNEGVAHTAYFHSAVPGPLGIGWSPDPEHVQADEVAGLHHVFGLFALALTIRIRWTRRWLAILLPYLAVVLLFRPPTRYLMPMFLALAALEAEAIVLILRRAATAVAIIVAIPAIAASAAFTFTSHAPWDYLKRRVDRETFLETRVPGYRAAKFVNSLPHGGRVMALDFPAPFYFDRPWIAEGMINDPPLQQWLADSRSADDLIARLQSENVRYIVVTPGYGGGTAAALMPLARNPREAAILAELRRRSTLLRSIDRTDIVAVPR